MEGCRKDRVEKGRVQPVSSFPRGLRGQKDGPARKGACREPHDLRSLARPHMVGGENRLLPADPHTVAHAHTRNKSRKVI